MNRDVFSKHYEDVKRIVLEEAANNGFTQMTGEIKPSQYNGWKGQIYFSLVTPNGTDQLFVEFEPQGDLESVYVNGAGTRTNGDSAAQAIQARLGKL